MARNAPGRDSDQYLLRLPDGMRGRLKVAAEESGRSMNAEIVARLERSFEAEAAPVVTDEALDKIVRQAVANSLYHVTKTMAAIVEAGKHSEDEGKPVNYVGMIRQMADEFKDNYEEEVGGDTGASK